MCSSLRPIKLSSVRAHTMENLRLSVVGESQGLLQVCIRTCVSLSWLISNEISTWLLIHHDLLFLYILFYMIIVGPFPISPPPPSTSFFFIHFSSFISNSYFYILFISSSTSISCCLFLLLLFLILLLLLFLSFLFLFLLLPSKSLPINTKKCQKYTYIQLHLFPLIAQVTS